jgi:adenylate cyclase class 2
MYEVEMKVPAEHDPVRERLAAMDADHVGRVTQIDTYYDAPDRDFAATDEAFRVRRETDNDDGARGGGTESDAGHSTETDTGHSTETDTGHSAEGSTDSEERVFLTYKGPLVDDTSKTREEAETRVADGEAIRAILAGLGYNPAATVRKERDRYAVAGCRVTLDRVERVGTFVEVEHHDAVTEGDIDRARETVTDLLRDLRLDPGEGIQTSYLGLLLAEDGQSPR